MNFRDMSVVFDPPSGITLRPGRVEDFSFAEALYLATTKPLLSALGVWDEAAARARLAAALGRHPHQVICAGSEGIGWLQVSATPEGIHLHQIHLSGSYRDRNIGSHLIGNILDSARRGGLPVTLNVIRGNRAIALYGRLGFEVFGGDTEMLRMRWQPRVAPLD